METRIRKRTLLENTFDHFLIVQKLKDYDLPGKPSTQTPRCLIRFSFPTSTDLTAQADEALYKSVTLFAFPEENKMEGIEHFTFVLTDGSGKWSFGYCRHEVEAETETERCFIFLSPIPYAESVFYRALNTCAKIKDLTSDKTGRGFLQHLHTTNLAYSLGRSRNASALNQLWSATLFIFPPPYGTVLPSTLDNRCLSEFYNSFTTKSMILVLASLLSERKILITSRKLSRLSSVALAFNLILYPLCWQHLFIPILPYSFGDYLEAPVPFIIGVPHSTFQRLRPNLNDVVFVDADADNVVSPFPQDLTSLPTGIRSFLKKHLTKDRLQGNGLARTFLRVLVKLMGNYEMALSIAPPTSKIGFDSERFLRLSKPSRRSYLRNTFLELQMFQQFIEERVQCGSSSYGPDIFQNEIDDKPGKCMRRKILSLHYPYALPTFLPRNQVEPQLRKPFTEKRENRNSTSSSPIYSRQPSHRVTCDPAIMRSWSTIVTELQEKSSTDSTVPDSASILEPEKPLIDFEGQATTVETNATGVDLIGLSHTASESLEESNKTIELLKKYGLYQFYAKKDQSAGPA